MSRTIVTRKTGTAKAVESASLIALGLAIVLMVLMLLGIAISIGIGVRMANDAAQPTTPSWILDQEAEQARIEGN